MNLHSSIVILIANLFQDIVDYRGNLHSSIVILIACAFYCPMNKNHYLHSSIVILIAKSVASSTLPFHIYILV